MFLFQYPDLTGAQVFHAVDRGRRQALGISCPVVTVNEYHRIMRAARVDNYTGPSWAVVDPQGQAAPLVIDNGKIDLSPLPWKVWPVDQQAALAAWVRHGAADTALHDGQAGAGVIRTVRFSTRRWEQWMGLEKGGQLAPGADLPDDGRFVAAWSAGPYTEYTVADNAYAAARALLQH